MSLAAHRAAIASLQDLYALKPELVVHDLHPDYASSHYASGLELPRLAVQHHYAHLLSCMTENELDPPVLGVIWDGTGYGLDGTIWGGEFLVAGASGFDRRAAFRSFPLPGSEKAIQEPRRSALGLLFELEGRSLLEREQLPPLQSFTPGQLEVLLRMLEKGLNSPRTTAVGRLFDAVSSLLGIRQQTRFEGQAAMELEFQADPNLETSLQPVATGVPGQDFYPLDWADFVSWLLSRIPTGPTARLATEFHVWLVETMLETAKFIGIEKVALSGGCFQNRLLTNRAIRRLSESGFKVYWHQRVPPNDGGLALGQIRAGVDYLRGGN